jgi:hypothetical protein
MDEYIDKFQDLIDQVGYCEELAIIMKFYKGLQRNIQNQIVQLANGHPDNADPDTWYICSSTQLCREHKDEPSLLQSIANYHSVLYLQQL